MGKTLLSDGFYFSIVFFALWALCTDFDLKPGFVLSTVRTEAGRLLSLKLKMGHGPQTGKGSY
jgi:hypothetical protein